MVVLGIHFRKHPSLRPWNLLLTTAAWPESAPDMIACLHMLIVLTLIGHHHHHHHHHHFGQGTSIWQSTTKARHCDHNNEVWNSYYNTVISLSMLLLWLTCYCFDCHVSLDVLLRHMFHWMSCLGISWWLKGDLDCSLRAPTCVFG